eukprot:12804491-Alexandrium_andersonii.AAC.1
MHCGTWTNCIPATPKLGSNPHPGTLEEVLCHTSRTHDGSCAKPSATGSLAEASAELVLRALPARVAALASGFGVAGV